jgi:hypothetical protein
LAQAVLITTTGDESAPAVICADSGATRFGETGASALEPLSALVTDSEENRMSDIAVGFSVERPAPALSTPIALVTVVVTAWAYRRSDVFGVRLGRRVGQCGAEKSLGKPVVIAAIARHVGLPKVGESGTPAAVQLTCGLWL